MTDTANKQEKLAYLIAKAAANLCPKVLVGQRWHACCSVRSGAGMTNNDGCSGVVVEVTFRDK
jgi:hypothetical protein